MRKVLSLGICILIMGTGFLYAQQKRISIEANYGFQHNFFVDDYDESPNSFSDINFYNKSVIGAIGGVEVKYKIGKRSRLGLGYAASVNSRVISYSGQFGGTSIGIFDFTITHKTGFINLIMNETLAVKPRISRQKQDYFTYDLFSKR